MDENEILEALNKNEIPFICFNCGNEINDCHDGYGDYPVAVLRYDTGTPSSWDDPGEPPSLYFECIKCYENDKKRRVD